MSTDRHASRLRAALALATLLLGLATPALAGTGGPELVWNRPLQNIADNLTGTTGRTIAIIMVVIGGLVWGFGRHEQGASKVGGIIVGVGLVLGASSFITTLGFEGATAAAPAGPFERALGLLSVLGGRP